MHRWFRFSAGYSAKWCADLMQKEKGNGRLHILDPFVGSGTTVIEAGRLGLDAIGLEAHPLMFRIAKAKAEWRNIKPERLRKLANEVLKDGDVLDTKKKLDYLDIIFRCFEEKSIRKLDHLKTRIEKLKTDKRHSELLWLALLSILRPCSFVGTAQWQYLLPNRSKRAKDPYLAFSEKIDEICTDITSAQSKLDAAKCVISNDDARLCSSVPDGWADLIITSPPYANNYDYADATRLELAFLGEIKDWSDLQKKIRKHLVTSCTQHVSRTAKDFMKKVNSPTLSVIRDELDSACQKMLIEKESHGGKKQYYAMVASYFFDLAQVWHALRRVTAKGGLICFVVGDSAPYGIHIPVDRWLGELAIAAGFKSYHFEKTRDRNIKWKNRKHRVPLHEGRLWVTA